MTARNTLVIVTRFAINFKPSSSTAARESVVETALKLPASEDSTGQLSVWSILNSGTASDLQETDDAESLEKESDLPWFSIALLQRSKVVTHERKSRHCFGDKQVAFGIFKSMKEQGFPLEEENMVRFLNILLTWV
ncbi:hypothetical protein ACLB2K_022763 [Fragaria x ananassa]